MKKILFLLAAALLCVSCEDFLDTENLTKKDTTNFPKSATDAEQMISGIYSTLNTAISNTDRNYYFVSELASDDRFGGGGENDKSMQASDKLMNSEPDMYNSFWSARYKGINRANMSLETLDNCEVDAATLNKYKGESHYLRAFFYHELAEMFGEVPLLLTTVAMNIPRTNIDLIYGQIAYDLKQAITLLPATKYNTVESGHATKWAAEALMARVFLFYTGFYGKADMPLGDGTGEANAGSITKQEVISWIDDCVANSGHGLINDFRRIWAYSNQYTAPDYDYVKDLADAGNTWVVDGTGNQEHVFVIKCSKMADWGTISGYANLYVLFSGMRGENGTEKTFPFGVGWGGGPVTPNLWEDWVKAEPNDMRREASIVNVTTDYPEYKWGSDSQVEDAGYWTKKFTPIRAYDSDGTLMNTFASLQWNIPSDDYQLGHAQDHPVIRFADVLLMQSELKGDAEGLNKVRARAGLPAKAYSLDALKNERRFELAFEGRRWADIRRWGDAPAALAKQQGVSIKNRGVDDVMRAFGGGYAKRYEETKGFFPLAKSELDLSEGVLEQNAGWGISNAEYPGW
ncbi:MULTISPECIES: RagB/SusD family nutrient uptake outer membrane protein [unclassified Parabacteroides]|uniref:RagB/SusD family nutrient uptake outer membrane protein n=1 Tax=unclassified Parabacteroides TaxID=2649774 RepID=UPI002473770D|nr:MULTISPECIES: RagB/SusD family nutrient uptake outer membrane protein [unclassified Parabacteroides]